MKKFTIAAALLGISAPVLAQVGTTKTAEPAITALPDLYSKYQLRKYDEYYSTSDKDRIKANKLQHRLYLGNKFLGGDLDVYYSERYLKAADVDEVKRDRPVAQAIYTAVDVPNFTVQPYFSYLGAAGGKGADFEPSIFVSTQTEVSTGAGAVGFAAKLDTWLTFSTTDIQAADDETFLNEDNEVVTSKERPIGTPDQVVEVILGATYTPNWVSGLDFGIDLVVDRYFTAVFEPSEKDEAEFDKYSEKNDIYNVYKINYAVSDNFTLTNELTQHFQDGEFYNPVASEIPEGADATGARFTNLVKATYTIL